jgi:hypothetical protein
VPSPRRSRSLLGALLCGVLLVAAPGCGPLDIDPAEAGPGEGNQHQRGQGATAARSQLETLAVSEWGSMARYSRGRFPHWSSQGGGCDTRDVVLKRDGRDVVTGDSCAIVQGTWLSTYDGQTVTDAQEVDVDHMIPLANAWRTGAASWTDEQREAFANDLDRPQLFAVTASSNRSKGDQDPSQWKPPRVQYWCVYARNWIAVKSHWRLSVTSKEKAALEDMLETC